MMKVLQIILLIYVSQQCSANVAANEEQGVLKNIMKNIGNFEIWSIDTPGIGFDAQALDRMGESMTHGDFNDDTFMDLAIGIPNFDFDFFGNITSNTGTVLILYGSVNGISANGSQYLFQTFDNSGGIEADNGVEANDFFGKSLASGDFNCDGIADLAVGTPNESITINAEVRNNVGAINIFYGSGDGFNNLGDGSTFLLQGSDGSSFRVSHSSDGDRFGWSLAAGNFDDNKINGVSCTDLAVSSPFENFGNNDSILDGGQVDIFYNNSLTGIDGSIRDTLTQNSMNIEGDIESNDQFGLSITAGYFDDFTIFGGGPEDLAVGIPGEDIDGVTDAGAVQVFYGSIAGLQDNADDEIWSQSGNIIGIVEEGDRFGSVVASGDLNFDAFDDLIISSTREDVGNVQDAGAVNIIYGSGNGLQTLNNQIIHNNIAGIEGAPGNSNFFGESLAVGSLNQDVFKDLVIGVPRSISGSGSFYVLYGSATGIETQNSELIGITDVGGNFGDNMGSALTIGVFGDNHSRLAVGVPGSQSINGDNDAGSIYIFEFIPIPEVIFINSFEE